MIAIVLSVIAFSTAVQAQQMSDTLKIYFRQGSSVYEPAFRNNADRASAFYRQVNEFCDNSSLFEILDVTYRAGASPEGSVEGNMLLSSRRCASVTRLLQEVLQFSESFVRFENVCEDWSGLSEILRHSSVPHKDEVIAIVSGNGESAKKKAALAALAGGSVWRYLEKEIFPELRAFTVIVTVGVRNPEIGGGMI